MNADTTTISVKNPRGKRVSGPAARVTVAELGREILRAARTFRALRKALRAQGLEADAILSVARANLRELLRIRRHYERVHAELEELRGRAAAAGIALDAAEPPRAPDAVFGPRHG